LSADVTATISATSILAIVPFGSTVTGLKATFTLSTGATVSVGGVAQTSNTSSNDFTNPVTYTVTAADGGTKDFVVTVIAAANPAAALTSFSFVGQNTPGTAGTGGTATPPNANLKGTTNAVITGTALSIGVAPGTDVTTLV